MSKKTLSSEKYLIDGILKKGKQIPAEWILDPGAVLRLLRRRLRMTQAMLAKKSKVPQTNIASIERGKKRPNLTTLLKLFEALGYQLAFMPVGELPSKTIKAQCKKTAEKNLSRVWDTMALEDQLPTKRQQDWMIQDRALRLMESETSEIWDE